MSGNNKRVYFACLGVAKCGSDLEQDVISASFSLSRGINNAFAAGNSDTIASYAGIPEIEFSYTSYLKTFIPIQNEYGLNDFVGFDLATGLDSSGSASFAGLFSGSSALLGGTPPPPGSPPNAAVRCSFANLTSVTYNMPVQGSFTVTRSYKGTSKPSADIPGPFTESEGSPLRRQCFTGSLPSNIANNAIQNLTITYSINRTNVSEFATRKPYASYVNFPIETTVNFEMLTQKLDTYTIDALQTACRNPNVPPEDININVEQAGSISIKKAYLTSLSYSGGDANTNENQTMSVLYTSYETIPNIKPVVKAPDEDPCGS